MFENQVLYPELCLILTPSLTTRKYFCNLFAYKLFDFLDYFP